MLSMTCIIVRTVEGLSRIQLKPSHNICNLVSDWAGLSFQADGAALHISLVWVGFIFGSRSPAMLQQKFRWGGDDTESGSGTRTLMGGVTPCFLFGYGDILIKKSR